MDDEPANVDLLQRLLEADGFDVLAATDGAQALRAAARARPHVILLDIVMPGMDGYDVCRRLAQDEATRRIPVLFVTARDELDALLEGFRAGAVDYVTKPFQEAEVLARVRAQAEIARLTEAVARSNLELERRNAELRAEMDRRRRAERESSEAKDAAERAGARAADLARREAERWGLPGFIGESPTLARILDDVRLAQEAPDVAVLITGESGTGKELVARALHHGSARADRPFVPVNCAAIPAELAESALFGHVKGGFSGATRDHRGWFEEADGGTLFLDEIGDMPLALQPKLLRALEERRVRPVGGTGERPVDIRVIAATNHDPATRIAEGRLRQDLYFRLARFPVHLPPLRERRGDIPLLALHFLDRYAREMGRPPVAITAEALAALDAYPFPGNVRELKNMMEYALLRSRGEPVRLEHLLLTRLDGPAGDADAAPRPGSPAHPAPRPEAIILAHVRQHGVIDNTACRELLGVDRRRASYLLGQLVHAGELVAEGERRWTRYLLP